jgi:hypothetical protein
MLNNLLISSNEYAQLEGKKTIQPADVIAALKENEFEHFIPRLEAELKSKYLTFPLPYQSIPYLTWFYRIQHSPMRQTKLLPPQDPRRKSIKNRRRR